MRSWGRALDAGLASTLLLACAGGGGGGDGGRFDEPPASSGAGNGRGSSSTGDGGFGNADGTPPPVFDDTVDDAGNGVNTTDDPDDVKCGGDRFKPEIRMEEIPGNLLLVFDKSASMEMGWGTTGSSKWDDALAGAGIR